MAVQNERMTIGNLIELLFNQVRKDNGKRYSTLEAANASGLTESTLRSLRYDIVSNPGIHTLIPITKFFGVPLTYFTAETEAEALGAIAESRGTLPKVEQWAFRLAHLSEYAQRDILRMVEWVEIADALRMSGGDLTDIVGRRQTPDE